MWFFVFFITRSQSRIGHVDIKLRLENIIQIEFVATPFSDLPTSSNVTSVFFPGVVMVVLQCHSITTINNLSFQTPMKCYLPYSLLFCFPNEALTGSNKLGSSLSPVWVATTTRQTKLLLATGDPPTECLDGIDTQGHPQTSDFAAVFSSPNQAIMLCIIYRWRF